MSSRIHILPPAVAERIAAGEVIELPASVVKELVENSLDAGATQVLVALEDGGKALIEVLDNGLGMNEQELRLAPLRHATSKLASLEDLDRIATLGFRGEALPSVAAVAELSILSRPRDSDTAHELVAGEPGGPGFRIDEATFGHFLGSAHGTRIRARGLFAQVPARLKFLKAASSEVREVRDWLERLALTHPATTFRLTSDERTVLELRAADEVERVRQILADGGDYPVLTAQGEIPGIRLRAHWVQGLAQAQTRKLLQIVNRRAVRDRVLQQAILQPFRQALLPGQFPAVALFIEADPRLLDVNVHPTKSEVRFLESGKVFKLVSQTLEDLVGRHGAPGFAAAPAQPPGRSSWGGGTFGQPQELPGLQGTPGFQSPPGPRAPAAWTWREPETRRLEAAGALGVAEDIPMGASPWSASEPPRTLSPIEGVPLAGVLFQTYLLFDLGQELVLVDQHAAHERIRYEKLKRRALDRAPGSSQQLLIPEPVPFAPESRHRLEERLAWLSRLGFDAEIFSDTSVLFRAVPLEWGSHDLRVRLKGLVDRLIETDAGREEALLDSALFEKIASEACHSAVRAGDRLDASVAQSLARELFESCEHPWNCPHGRPTLVRVPRSRFEEWFQRRV